MDEGESIAYVTDIPPVRRPQVRAYRVQVCRCRSCGKAVRGQHPDIGSDQRGASAHRLGDRVKAAAHVLHYGVGVPVRRIPAVLRALTGVEVSQGAISQDALRRSADAVGEAYRTLRTSVRASPVVHTDDTGWRVGGEPAGGAQTPRRAGGRACERERVRAVLARSGDARDRHPCEHVQA